MKQQITLKQWDELTKKQKNVLWNSGFRRDWRMNIGQMLDFLGDDFISVVLNNDGYKITVEERDKDGNIMMLSKSYDNVELCNSLWEAVKYKLK